MINGVGVQLAKEPLHGWLSQQKLVQIVYVDEGTVFPRVCKDVFFENYLYSLTNDGKGHSVPKKKWWKDMKSLVYELLTTFVRKGLITI